jgi:hypothetical protein
LSNLTEFDSSQFAFRSRQRIAGHSFLIRRPSISLDLTQAGMTGNDGDLVGRTSGFGEPSACCFAQSMKRSMRWQSGFVAPISEPLAETLRTKRLAECRCQERHRAAWRGTDDRE